jgi:hypothetical protein
MIEAQGALGLWLPASALCHQVASEISPGALVLTKPPGAFTTPSLGLRFDVNEFRFLLALTAFHEGRSPPGAAIDITNAQTAAFWVDVPFTIEADLTQPVRRYGREEPEIGAMVAGEEGAGLVGHCQGKLEYCV